MRLPFEMGTPTSLWCWGCESDSAQQCVAQPIHVGLGNARAAKVVVERTEVVVDRPSCGVEIFRAYTEHLFGQPRLGDRDQLWCHVDVGPFTDRVQDPLP